MIEYMNHLCGDRYWRELGVDFKFKPTDFNYSYFKIDDTIYVAWSKQFEKALLWERLND